MRKHNNKMKPPVRRSRRLMGAAIVAALIIASGAISVLSRQIDKNPLATVKADSVNRRLASQDVYLDGQTGQGQQLTDDEAQKLGAGLKELVNQSTEGLVEVKHADGSVSVDLEGRFQNVAVARVNKDGSVTQSCVDNPRSAAAFFGIDPKLIDPTIGSTTAKPAKVSPVRNKN